MKHRILFVEDEPAFALGMTDRLESEGYDVERAATERPDTKWRWHGPST